MSYQSHSGPGDNVVGNKNINIKGGPNLNLGGKNNDSFFAIIAFVLLIFVLCFIAPGIALTALLRYILPELQVGQIWGISIVFSLLILFGVRYSAKSWMDALKRYAALAAITGILIGASGLIMNGNKMYNTTSYMLGYFEPGENPLNLKNDLIGEKIDGWNLKYLTEFEKFEILYTHKAPTRIEYEVQMKLRASAEKSKELKAIISYTGSVSSGIWSFEKIKVTKETD